MVRKEKGGTVAEGEPGRRSVTQRWLGVEMKGGTVAGKELEGEAVDMMGVIENRLDLNPPTHTHIFFLFFNFFNGTLLKFLPY